MRIIGGKNKGKKGGKERGKERKNVSRKYLHKSRKNKTIKASSKKIARALKKKQLDNGNISTYIASVTPEKYFSKKEIAVLNQ